ncbi:NAD(P)-binding protein-15 [Coleophoma crateriformis]|uniref:NAD(P)-binding protein-15 n=1 Tax=Coleophoma crateriformis TaxID=565419 RepID=A0A3D8T7A7_9HELO|nr:NAD(P)-binding protein-15 [Coleophoma crateriformis]
MPLTVLSDANIKSLLQDLTQEDLFAFQQSLRSALYEYSTGTQDEGCCSLHQPKRTALTSGNGTTTLFMPSTSSGGIGMKVVTLATPGSEKASTGQTCPQGALTLMDTSGTPFGFLNAEEVTAFRTALASSLLVARRRNVKTLTVYGAGKQAFWHVRLALLLRGSTIKTVNFINRTFSDRARDLLKGFYAIDMQIKESEGWATTKFGMLTPGYGEFSRLEKDHLRAADIIFTTTPSTDPLFDPTILTNTEGRKKGRLIIAIGSYKPNMIELPTELLTQATKVHGSGHHFHKHAEEGGVVVVDTLDACLKEAGEIIQSGLSPQQLVEIGELVMLQDESQSSSSSLDLSDSPVESFSKLDLQPENGGKSLAHVFRENSMESARTGSTMSNGSRSVSRKSSFSGSHSRSGSFLGLGKKSGSVFSNNSKEKAQTSEEDKMSRWLCHGNVIYKSVGMGLMDLIVGADLVRLANEKGVGVTIDSF